MGLDRDSPHREHVEFPGRGGMPQARKSRPAVLIADDHLMLAQALAHLLADDCNVIAAVNNAQELLLSSPSDALTSS